MNRVRSITGCPEDSLIFRNVDLCDSTALEGVLEEGFRFDACIHFAGLKAVGESVQQPIRYYENNIYGTLNLVRVLADYGCKSLVFSSSATVYGLADPKQLITEKAPTGCTNPYGRTKLFIEEILRDVHRSDKKWNILLLRYFNPVGAHPSGTMGEDPQGIPNNLMPFVAQVCVGRRAKLSVFGNDYNTPDGTGVRDYIHVVDLAKGHVKALDRLLQPPGPAPAPAAPGGADTTTTTAAAAAAAAGGTDEGAAPHTGTAEVFKQEGGLCLEINLGTGRGASVLELVHEMEAACAKPIPYEVVGRRSGDVEKLVCDPTLAKEFLQWEASKTLKDICEDTWRWQSGNPNGYA